MLSKIKRFIVMPVLLATILVGGTAGVIMADEETDTNNTPPQVTLQELVARYLQVSLEDLRSALREARELVKDIEDPQEARREFGVIINRILINKYDAAMTWQEALEAAKEAYKRLMQQNKEQRKENIRNQQNEMRERLQAQKTEMRQQLEARKIEMKEQLENRKAQMRSQLQLRKEQMQQQRNEWRHQIQAGNAERREQHEETKQNSQARHRINRMNATDLAADAYDIPVEAATENITVY